MSTMTTATTAGARDHARAQEATARAEAARTGMPCWGPTVPASAADPLPEGVAAEAMTWAEFVAPGGYAHKELARGTVVEFLDVDADASVSLLLHVATGPWERLSIADTLKVQWQVASAEGQVLLSDQGRALATVVLDESGHHDAFFGPSTLAGNEARYGDGSPEGASPAGRELLKLAAGKHGLTPADVGPSLGLFQGVRIDDGRPVWLGNAGPGRRVRLRLELPVVLSVANTAHPRDPRPAYTVGPVRIAAWRDRPTTPDDPEWSSTPERRRAYANTADLLTARGDL